METAPGHGGTAHDPVRHRTKLITLDGDTTIERALRVFGYRKPDSGIGRLLRQ